MEFHLSLSTMTAAWPKPSQGSLDLVASLMTLLFMTVTVIPNNTQPMSSNFYNDVQTNTLINASSARLRSPLQDSGCPPKVTKLITQSWMPYPSSQNLPTGQICILCLDWSISSHPDVTSLLTPLRPHLSTKYDFIIYGLLTMIMPSKLQKTPQGGTDTILRTLMPLDLLDYALMPVGMALDIFYSRELLKALGS